MIKSRIQMGRAHSAHGGDEKFVHLVKKPDEKRILGRPRRRWEDNIKMDIRKCGLIHLA
jgi:hypothetical protein